MVKCPRKINRDRGDKGCFLNQSNDVLIKLHEVKVKQLIDWRL